MTELHPHLYRFFGEFMLDDEEETVAYDLAISAQREIEAAALESAAELALEKRDAVKLRNPGAPHRRMALESFAENLRTRAARIRKGEV